MEKREGEFERDSFVEEGIIPVFRHATELIDSAIAAVEVSDTESQRRLSRRVRLSLFLARIQVGVHPLGDSNAAELSSDIDAISSDHFPIQRMRIESLLRANFTQKVEVLLLSAGVCTQHVHQHFDLYPDPERELEIIETIQAQEDAAQALQTIENLLTDNIAGEVEYNDLFGTIRTMISTLESGVTRATQLRFIQRRSMEYGNMITESDKLVERGMRTLKAYRELSGAKQELRQFMAQFELTE